MPSLLPSDPREIGRYKVLESIAGHGLTRIFKATKETEPVAIKILLYVDLSDQQTRERFQREIRLATQLPRHRNLCNVSDWGVDREGSPFVVQDLLTGETLAERLTREERLPLPEARLIVMQILDGLAVIHEGGIVHRGLSPENVFLCTDGVVKILDFGLARDEVLGELTETGQSILGAPYCSPEVLMDGKRADARSDLFSVGLLTYHALSGRLPYEGSTPRQYLTNLLQGEYPPLELPRVDPWLARLLAPQREKRYATARETLAALDW